MDVAGSVDAPTDLARSGSTFGSGISADFGSGGSDFMMLTAGMESDDGKVHFLSTGRAVPCVSCGG